MASEAGPLTVAIGVGEFWTADQRVPTGSMPPLAAVKSQFEGTDWAIEPYSRRLAQHRRRTRRSATYSPFWNLTG